ncbi:MAG: hypothetical protein APR63_03345 [Desulfuromonas sp. SDB]|nr:MAG: hypothetical protein APR63_03345 [Desulfuromonas sp. SDB]
MIVKYLIITLLIPVCLPGATILFDQAHSQTNWSSYDFIVDDNAPVPQPYPPTSAHDWNGQLSTWGYELYLAGHTIRINTDFITPGVLDGIDLLIIPEPQDTFSLQEMDAIEDFVVNGGNLFIIADHNSSDRNHNDWDSPSIFNGFVNPHITTPPGADTSRFIKPRFGFYLHVNGDPYNAYSDSFTNVSNNNQDPIIYGFYGEVDTFTYHQGDVFTVFPNYNLNLDSVRGHIWVNNKPQNNTLIIVATALVGNGKVAGIGDSSPFCDGSGPTTHENNWIEHDNRELILNTSRWLLDQGTSTEESQHYCLQPINYSYSGNQLFICIPFYTDQSIILTDLSGRIIAELSPCNLNQHTTEYSIHINLQSSVYFIRGNNINPIKLINLDS